MIDYRPIAMVLLVQIGFTAHATTPCYVAVVGQPELVDIRAGVSLGNNGTGSKPTLEKPGWAVPVEIHGAGRLGWANLSVIQNKINDGTELLELIERGEIKIYSDPVAAAADDERNSDYGAVYQTTAFRITLIDRDGDEKSVRLSANIRWIKRIHINSKNAEGSIFRTLAVVYTDENKLLLYLLREVLTDRKGQIEGKFYPLRRLGRPIDVRFHCWGLAVTGEANPTVWLGTEVDGVTSYTLESDDLGNPQRLKQIESTPFTANTVRFVDEGEGRYRPIAGPKRPYIKTGFNSP